MLLSQDKLKLLETEVEHGEELLWSGQPNPFRVASRSIYVFLLGIVWTAFLSAGALMLWPLHGDGFFLGIFVLGVFGIGFLSTPVWAYVKATRTVYGITTKRVLIVQNGMTLRAESWNKMELGNIKRIERSDSTGDLTFAQIYRDSGEDRQTIDIQLIGIPKVHEVETVLRKVLTSEGQETQTAVK